MRTTGRWLLVVACAAILAGGCGGDDGAADPLATTSLLPSPTATPPPSGGSDGISVDEARRRGVLVGPYDAKITSRRRVGDDVYELVLQNIGTEADAYEVSVDPRPDLGPPAPAPPTVTPSAVDLRPDGRAVLRVDRNGGTSAEIVVVSRGRSAEVIREPVSP